MRRIIPLLLVALSIPTWPQTQTKPDNEVRQAFSPGGKIYLRLSPGGYTISGTNDNNIVVTYDAANKDSLKRVRVRIAATGSHADVAFSNTPRNNFHATIEVPARSDLEANLAAGEIVIDGVEGNKDVEVYAGRIEIKIPHPEEYGHREASVRAGSIQASAFDVSKGGLFRSFEQNGRGKYRLRAHVTTGEIDLVGSK